MLFGLEMVTLVYSRLLGFFTKFLVIVINFSVTKKCSNFKSLDMTEFE